MPPGELGFKNSDTRKHLFWTQPVGTHFSSLHFTTLHFTSRTPGAPECLSEVVRPPDPPAGGQRPEVRLPPPYIHLRKILSFGIRCKCYFFLMLMLFDDPPAHLLLLYLHFMVWGLWCNTAACQQASPGPLCRGWWPGEAASGEESKEEEQEDTRDNHNQYGSATNHH